MAYSNSAIAFRLKSRNRWRKHQMTNVVSPLHNQHSDNSFNSRNYEVSTHFLHININSKNESKWAFQWNCSALEGGMTSVGLTMNANNMQLNVISYSPHCHSVHQTTTALHWLTMSFSGFLIRVASCSHCLIVFGLCEIPSLQSIHFSKLDGFLCLIFEIRFFTTGL